MKNCMAINCLLLTLFLFAAPLLPGPVVRTLNYYSCPLLCHASG